MMLYDHESMKLLKAGDVLWDQINLEPHLESQEYRRMNKLVLLQRWSNAAVSILVTRPELRLTWPIVTETAEKIELKAEVELCP